MALDDSALLEVIEMLRTADGGELMRWLLGGMLQAVVDAEATEHIGAGLHQRSTERTTHHNGTRDKTVTTAAGDLTVNPQAPVRVVLPGAAGAPPPDRRRSARRRDAGLCRGRLNPTRR